MLRSRPAAQAAPRSVLGAGDGDGASESASGPGGVGAAAGLAAPLPPSGVAARQAEELRQAVQACLFDKKLNL